jgi:hypothetical protein
MVYVQTVRSLQQLHVQNASDTFLVFPHVFHVKMPDLWLHVIIVLQAILFLIPLSATAVPKLTSWAVLDALDLHGRMVNALFAAVSLILLTVAHAFNLPLSPHQILA